MMPKNRAVILVGILALLSALAACQSGALVAVETITLGLPPLEQNALVYIAEQQGLFAQNNIKIVVKDYDSGVATIDALTKGEVDLAEAAEFPFVGAVLRQQAISILTVNDKFENDYVVVRPNRGIAKASDLRGKRIGVARGAITEFFLGRLLDLQGIRPDEVTLVDYKPAQYVSAVANGDVDALVAWQPYIYQIQQQVRGVTVLPAQSDQPVYGVMVGRNDWLKQHAPGVVRFLQALHAAEDYNTAHPAQAKAIVQKRLGYDDGYMGNIWMDHHWALSLDYSLVVAMTDEARWMIKNNLTTQKQAPDFVNFIYLDGLKTVKPEAVDISR